MSILKAFIEVGHFCLAVLVPIALLILMSLNRSDRKGMERDEREGARNATNVYGAVGGYITGDILTGFLLLVQVILFLLLVLSIVIGTVPYGHSHGWW